MGSGPTAQRCVHPESQCLPRLSEQSVARGPRQVDPSVPRANRRPACPRVAGPIPGPGHAVQDRNSSRARPFHQPEWECRVFASWDGWLKLLGSPVRMNAAPTWSRFRSRPDWSTVLPPSVKKNPGPGQQKGHRPESQKGHRPEPQKRRRPESQKRHRPEPQHRKTRGCPRNRGRSRPRMDASIVQFGTQSPFHPAHLSRSPFQRPAGSPRSSARPRDAVSVDRMESARRPHGGHSP
jgi:hypothetical protein